MGGWTNDEIFKYKSSYSVAMELVLLSRSLLLGAANSLKDSFPGGGENLGTRNKINSIRHHSALLRDVYDSLLSARHQINFPKEDQCQQK
jgi:hypothetical protein